MLYDGKWGVCGMADSGADQAKFAGQLSGNGRRRRYVGKWRLDDSPLASDGLG